MIGNRRNNLRAFEINKYTYIIKSLDYYLIITKQGNHFIQFLDNSMYKLIKKELDSKLSIAI